MKNVYVFSCYSLCLYKYVSRVINIHSLKLLSSSVCPSLSVPVCVRPAGPADRPDKDFRLSGGGEAAAALRPLRVPPASRRHRGGIRAGPRQTHRKIHPQD